MAGNFGRFIVAGALFALTAGCSGGDPASDPLEGSWTLKAVEFATAEDSTLIDPAQPGRFIFADGQYTLIWTYKRTPREPFADLSNWQNEEMVTAFQTIVFNSGKYEIDGDNVETTADLARVPGFEGGQQFYEFEIEGDVLNLRMVDETYPDGRKPDWSGKQTTLFVLERE